MGCQSKRKLDGCLRSLVRQIAVGDFELEELSGSFCALTPTPINRSTFLFFFFFEELLLIFCCSCENGEETSEGIIILITHSFLWVLSHVRHRGLRGSETKSRGSLVNARSAVA